ncbi:MAG: c-type cytochrome [Planctomycetes bacterium]|nr:c-type cytochrome [Planctomycetota bacterium]
MPASFARWLPAVTLAVLATAQAAEARGPRWIAGTAGARGPFVFVREFDVEQRVTAARLHMTADFGRAEVRLGDERIASQRPYEQPVWSSRSADPMGAPNDPYRITGADVTEFVRLGRNRIEIRLEPVAGPSAVLLRLDLDLADGRRESIISDGKWRVATPTDGEPRWTAPVDRGPAVEPAYRFGDSIAIRPADDYEQWKQAQGTGDVSDPATFQTRPGFAVELLRSAAPDEGSWIALVFDPQGRLIIAREDRGLLRMTLGEPQGVSPRVELIEDTLHECRGLLFVNGSLYATANNDRALYRLTDTNGDGRFADKAPRAEGRQPSSEEVQLVSPLPGDVGHGRNQLHVGPDGLVYLIAGDAVFEPQDTRSLVPTPARPTPAETTRSGYLARLTRGGRWEIVCRGLRNPFGVAFNAAGDAFTYDADAEYDMGAPWYRPTRVVQLVSGGDFGWRRVTGQWPPYYPDRPDMPAPLVDIGKGSPTAVCFGSSGNFPQPYSDALFILDWAYGRIIAVHLTPYGAGYRARPETFLRGRPLNVTDVEFGPDGAMYFVTGGRGTQSALYRVTYDGPIPAPWPESPQAAARREFSHRARLLRRRLESFHGRVDPEAIEAARPLLADADPWLRHAARVAIEHQPAEGWQRRALSEPNPAAAVAALTALARVGPADLQPEIAGRLLELPLAEMWPEDVEAVLFLYRRFLDDEPGLSPRERHQTRAQVDPLYPADSPRLNRRLSELLAMLDAPQFVPRTLPLLAAADSQGEQMHYLFVLRDRREGWTDESREAYFRELAEMDGYVGGEGLPVFRRRIREEALASVPEPERGRFESLLAESSRETPAPPSGDRPFVREWKLADLVDAMPALAQGSSLALRAGVADTNPKRQRGRRPERGREMFAAAQCVRCHRVGTWGGTSGPDLTGVARRFSARDLLTSIVDPSRVVAEKYRNDVFALSDGRTVTGHVISEGDFRSAELSVVTDPLRPDKLTTIRKSDIELHRPSPVSPMPAGLLNSLTREEILDLLAWLLSEGDEQPRLFR